MHATLADVIADTTQNSIEAGASRVELTVVERDNRIAVTIVDNGKGMDADTVSRAFNPFYTEPGKHDSRRVGLGLPILKQICDECDGGVKLESEPGRGTRLEYHFRSDHIDLPPMGDLVEMVMMLFNYPGEFELVFTHRKGDAVDYTISRGELAEAVGGFESPDSLAMAREFLSSQENS